MKKTGIVAALIGAACMAESMSALSQGNQIYWTTSGMFGPFPITGLIPSVPKEKARDLTIPVSMFVIDHPKGLVVFDTGNNKAISDGAANCKAYWAPGNCDFLKPSQRAEDVIDMQLKKLGYSADKVKVVISSRSHLDHLGNIEENFASARSFEASVTCKKQNDCTTTTTTSGGNDGSSTTTKRCVDTTTCGGTVTVNKLDVGANEAWFPEKFQRRTTPGKFVMADIDNAREFNYLELEGEYDLFGDGSVLIDTAPNGQLSVKYKLASGRTIISDFGVGPGEGDELAGLNYSVQDYTKSVNRLKFMRDQEGADLFAALDETDYTANGRRWHK